MSLALDRYSGRTMLFGAVSTALPKLHEYAEGLGLSILSPLLTPFRDSDLHDHLAEFPPVPAPPQIEIEADTGRITARLSQHWCVCIRLCSQATRGRFDLH